MAKATVANPPLVPLQGHEGIRMRVEDGVNNTCIVEYIGPSLVHLHAAGCVTDGMMELLARGRKGANPFRDENGDRFCRRPRKTAAYRNGVCVIRWIKPSEKGGNGDCMSLPGVAAYIDANKKSHAGHEQADSRCEPTVGEFLKLFPGRAWKKRERCVGRFQRPAEWTSIANVLFIDWRNIRRQVAQPCS